MIDPKEFIITRKRKKYKFALFANSPICFEAAEWIERAPFAPNILEIGAGNGLFSVANAAVSPAKNFVAVDVKADRMQHGARKAQAEKLENIAFVRLRADELLDNFGEHSLEAIWVTFPDPFPRDRSAKHRLTHRRFLELYATLLQSGGMLYFKTDNHALFDWSIEELITYGWRIDQLTYDLHGSELPKHYKYLTTYEQRFLAEGLTTCFFRAVPPHVAEARRR